MFQSCTSRFSDHSSDNNAKSNPPIVSTQGSYGELPSLRRPMLILYYYHNYLWCVLDHLYKSVKLSNSQCLASLYLHLINSSAAMVRLSTLTTVLRTPLIYGAMWSNLYRRIIGAVSKGANIRYFCYWNI